MLIVIFALSKFHPYIKIFDIQLLISAGPDSIARSPPLSYLSLSTYQFAEFRRRPQSTGSISFFLSLCPSISLTHMLIFANKPTVTVLTSKLTNHLCLDIYIYIYIYIHNKLLHLWFR